MPSDRTTAEAAGDDLTPRQSDLDEARDHLAATGEILTAIGTSASDLEAVLGTVVESARRLCRADAALIILLEDGAFRVTAAVGVSDDYREHMVRHPIVADRATLSGRVALDRRAQQIADVLADPEYGRPDVQRVAGFRTMLGVPMLVEDEVVGVLSVWRTRSTRSATGPSTGHHVRGPGRARHPQRRPVPGAAEPHHELADKVEQLEALRSRQAVSSSLDPDEVLTRSSSTRSALGHRRRVAARVRR